MVWRPCRPLHINAGLRCTYSSRNRDIGRNTQIVAAVAYIRRLGKPRLGCSVLANDLFQEGRSTSFLV